MIKEESEEREIKLRPIGKSIGWVIVILLVFFLYEAMSREFIFFDEFSVFFMLFLIALELTRFRRLYEKKDKETEIE